MILGIGTDVAQIDRFLDNTSKLASKILTENEYTEFTQAWDKACYLAKRWAAKEAISKAWGSGIAGDTKWKSIEIQHDEHGKPSVIFYDKLKENMTTLNARCHVTISDEEDYTVAFAVVERI